MVKLKQVLIKAARVLAKKKIGPVRLAQTLHLPLGPLYIIQVGDLDRNILPTSKDLLAVNKVVVAELKKVKELRGRTHSLVLFPPILNVKEVFVDGGALRLVIIGDSGLRILPEGRDIARLKALLKPEFKRLGCKDPVIYSGPVIEARAEWELSRYGRDRTIWNVHVLLYDFPKGKRLKRATVGRWKKMITESMKEIGVGRRSITFFEDPGQYLDATSRP